MPDPTDGLGQTAASDQILLIQFQNSTVSGDNMPFSSTTSLFNLYDNTNGFYLEGGQSDTHTLAQWIALEPFLAGESIDQIRIGMGLAGGSAPGGSVQLDSLTGDYTTPTPEPSSVAVIGAALLGIAFCSRRARRGLASDQS